MVQQDNPSSPQETKDTSASTEGSPSHSGAAPQASPRRENMFANIMLNIALPTLILVKGSKEEYFGPTLGVIIALAFPIGYGIYSFTKAHKLNIFSLIGFFSVLLTGGISLLKLPPEYMAIKEATIPGLLGLATLVSVYTRYPLVRTFLYNDNIMQVDKVHLALEKFGNVDAFEQTLKNASYMLAGSFFLSSMLNYILAKVVLVSEPGTAEYNSQLGTMTALSFPVITLPSMAILIVAMFYLFRSITKLTHMHWEEVMIQPSSDTDKQP